MAFIFQIGSASSEVGWKEASFQVTEPVSIGTSLIEATLLVRSESMTAAL